MNHTKEIIAKYKQEKRVEKTKKVYEWLGLLLITIITTAILWFMAILILI